MLILNVPDKKKERKSIITFLDLVTSARMEVIQTFTSAF